MQASKRVLAAMLALATLPGAALGQTSGTTGAAKPRTTTRKASARAAEVTAEDIRALRDAMAAQQEQIRQLQQQLQQRESAAQQELESIRQAQATAQEAQTRAAAAEQAATRSGESTASVTQEIADIKATQTSIALSAQDDQKRIGAAEGFLNRFRMSGDIRVRYENFFAAANGCSETATVSCNARHRARFRARFGIDGKLGESFLGGFALASGDLSDPVSTNQTLSGFFNRKVIAIDRAYVTYAPSAFKPLSLTGGKFAYTWVRTPMMFDNDMNPEGFSQRLGWTFANPNFQAFNVIGMQMLFQENSGSRDAYATGVQGNAKLVFGRVTLNPAMSYIIWNNENSIAQARTPAAAAGATVPAAELSGTNMTNRTAVVSGRRVFLSGFRNTDYILDTTIKTSSARFPVKLLLEFNRNLDAVNDQSDSYWTELAVGQTRNKGDWQAGYGFTRIEQDAVLAPFNESDLRNPTNVINHRAFLQYVLMANTTLAYTAWIGRTLNTSLPQANFSSGIVAGDRDPWLRRMQFDVIYKF